MQNDNARERDIERRLGRLESPEPPADLLDRIRADIPEYLRPVAEAEDPTSRRPRRYMLAAASVFLAVVGGLLAYRVFQTAPEPPGVSAQTPSQAGRMTAPAPMTSEVGAVAAPSKGRKTPAPSVPLEPYPQPAAAEALAANEELKERPAPQPEAYRTADRDAAEPVHSPTTEVGPPAPNAFELAERLRDRREGGESRRRIADEIITEEITVEAELPKPRTAVTGARMASPKDKKVGETPSPPPPTARQMTTEEILVVKPSRRQRREERRRQRRDEKRRQVEVGVPQPPSPAPGPSTGGTAEPNDQPWGDMFFRSYGTNPFVDTEDDAQSTFGLDVDTGSYTLARGYLERGHLPPPEAIRVEEFVNFFDYRDPAPRRGEFTLTAEGAPSPWARGPRYQLLRVGVHGRQVSAAQRREATLIFVVDVSGSMARQNRIQLVKRALHLLLDQLGTGDRVGLVVYGSQGRVLLEPSGDLQTVRRAIDGLSTGGSTNAEEGLVLAYDLARRYFRPESINRLVLCSDGVANVGSTGPESILARIGREAGDGIELTTVGFGMGNYNDVLMEQLADQGDGNYAYVDTLEEARRVFVENLTGTLQTIAADAKIQVEFDPRAVTRYRLLGYENRDVADHRFRDDTVDAGEIGAGHRVTALYEIKLADGATRRRALAEVRLRYRSQATGQVVEDSIEVRRSDLARSWRAAAPSRRLAALAAELAEVLKRSYWAREIHPEDLRERARAVGADFDGDRDIAELVRLTHRVAELVDWPEPPPE